MDILFHQLEHMYRLYQITRQEGQLVYIQGALLQCLEMGYELDLTLLTDAEENVIAQQIQDYKKYWKLIQHGLYYRGDSQEKGGEYTTWNFVSEDKSEELIRVI